MNGYKFVRFVGRLYAKVFYRVEFFGAENEPSDGGCIVIANHSSFFDPISVACALKRPVSFMGKSTLLKHKFMQWLFKSCNVIPVNRGESDIAALRKICAIVDSGDVTGVFPQGTRIRCACPKADEAMAGIGLMASRTKAPFLPVAICYGKKNDHPTLFKKVKVYIGKPIPYEEYSTINEHPNSHEIAKYAFSKVCDLFAENNHD